MQNVNFLAVSYVDCGCCLEIGSILRALVRQVTLTCIEVSLRGGRDKGVRPLSFIYSPVPLPDCRGKV